MGDTNGNDRVTTKQFYELQLETIKEIQGLSREVVKLYTRFDGHLEADKVSTESIERKFTEQKKSIEVVAADVAEFSDDFTIHKVNDNRFKSFTGVVMAIVVGVETYFASK